MLNIKTIADDADIIVNGYAFNRYENGYRVLNLHRSDKAAVFSQEGEVLETSMDDIELSIVSDYLYEKQKVTYRYEPQEMMMVAEETTPYGKKK